jgi:hypothetical protein
MRKPRFTESQIVNLKDGDAGLPLAELVRKHGISRATYFNWKSKYAGATVRRSQAHERAGGGERQAEADVRGARVAIEPPSSQARVFTDTRPR